MIVLELPVAAVNAVLEAARFVLKSFPAYTAMFEVEPVLTEAPVNPTVIGSVTSVMSPFASAVTVTSIAAVEAADNVAEGVAIVNVGFEPTTVIALALTSAIEFVHDSDATQDVCVELPTVYFKYDNESVDDEPDVTPFVPTEE